MTEKYKIKIEVNGRPDVYAVYADSYKEAYDRVKKMCQNIDSWSFPEQ